MEQVGDTGFQLKGDAGTRHYIDLQTEQFEQNQVKEALNLARSNFLQHPSDWFTVKALEWNLKHSPELTGKTARSFFMRRFTDENAAARELNIEGESIDGAAGVWRYTIPIEPFPQDATLVMVKLACEEADRKNTEGLKRIYDQNAGLIGDLYPFEDRVSPHGVVNTTHWLEVLQRNKDLKTGTGFMDWDVRIKDGKVVSRSREPKFEYVVKKPNYDGDLDVDMKAIANRGLIAQIVLVENREGLIDKVKVYIPHLNNEEQARKILQNLSENLPLSQREEYSTEILRQASVKEFGKWGPEIPILDIATSFKLSPSEDMLISLALSSIEPRMNLSSYLAEAWLGISNSSAAYVCVSPDKPRPNEESVASGLQLALLPRGKEIKALKNILTNIKSSQNVTAKSIVKEGLSAKVVNEIQKVSGFMKKEIERAQKALSTLSILDTFLSTTNKRMFAYIFRRQNSLVSEGAFQISSVNYRNENNQNFVFGTALALPTDTSLAVSNFKDKRVLELRTRTDVEDYKKTIADLKRLGINSSAINIHNVREWQKLKAKEKVIDYRLTLVILSLKLAASHINKKYPGESGNDPLSDLYDMGDEAIKEILEYSGKH